MSVLYDRELIAEMLIAYADHAACDMDLVHLETSILEQADLLLISENNDASQVHTARCPHGSDLAA